MLPIAEKVEKAVENLDMNIKVAVMGCAVNGPGEAAEADIGVAGAIGEAVLFSHGKIIRRIPEEKLVEELINEVKILAEQ